MRRFCEPHTRRSFLTRAALLATASALPRGLLASGREPAKVILDVDVGIDDAFAILMAHYSPAIDLLGLTTVFGNTDVDVGTRNSLFLKERFGIEAEVYPGAAAALHDPRGPAPAFVHGEDGLGDVEESISPTIPASSTSAPEFMVRSILEDPGEVTVILVGPFTNLMIARLLAPEIVEKVGQVIVMGGAVGFEGERGNATMVAEANVINDPHAADALFRYGWPVTMVGLDVTYTADSSTGPEYMRELARDGGEAGAFLERINRYYMDFYLRSRGLRESFQHDSIAVALAIDPDLFETRRGKLRVLTSGVARGQTIFCPVGHHNFDDPEWADLPTHTVCSRLDGPGFRDLYRRTIVGGSTG